MFKKILYTVLLLLLYVILFVGYHSFDTSEPDLSDFVVDYPKVSDEENLAFQLRKLDPEIQALFKGDGILSVESLPKNYENFEKQTAELYKKIDKALNSKVYLAEPQLDPKQMDMKPLITIFKLRDLLKIRVLRSVYQGDFVQVKKYLNQYRQLIIHVSEWPRNLIEYSTSIGGRSGYLDLLNFVQEIKPEWHFDESFLFNPEYEFLYFARGIKAEVNQAFFKSGLMIDKKTAEVLDAFVGPAGYHMKLYQRSKVPYLYRPHKTQKLILDFYNKEISKFEKLQFFTDYEVKEEFDFDAHFYQPNAVGKAYMNMFGDTIKSTVSKVYKLKVYNQLLMLKLLFKGFEEEHGELPITLGQLDAQGLLLDLFNGEALQYDAKKRMIVSMGDQSKDIDELIEQSPVFSKMTEDLNNMLDDIETNGFTDSELEEPALSPWEKFIEGYNEFDFSKGFKSEDPYIVIYL